MIYVLCLSVFSVHTIEVNSHQNGLVMFTEGREKGIKVWNDTWMNFS